MRRFALAAVALFAAACATGSDGPTSPTTPPKPPTTPPSADPPALSREFRGLWVATVGNYDWPSTTGLTQASQLVEMRAILDRAQLLRMNAVILQVRSAGDAIYRSSIEPWAKVLTGTQGVDPGWDPLEAWVTEAHQRGLELHAWFNPYRAAGSLSDTLRLAANHLAKRRPDLVRIAEGVLVFDPGEPEVRQHTLNVIADVVTRYDIDAVHLDDYFYPYPQGTTPVFPDDATYNKYLAAGGTAMARTDWRRYNVDTFIEQLYAEVHRVRPAVKVGLSPFGIWRPGYPPGTTGTDAYGVLFADSKKWLESGWVDYMAPQLYWSLSTTGHDFTSLLDWWISVNTKKRHLWPGLAAYHVADGTSSAYAASEITNEISVARARAGPNAGGGSGTLLFRAAWLTQNRGALADALLSTGYPGNTLVPAYTWLDATPPAAPSLSVTTQTSAMRAAWTPNGTEAARWWLVQWRNATTWNARLVWGADRQVDLAFTGATDRADVVVLTALDAAWNASPSVTWRASAMAQ